MDTTQFVLGLLAILAAAGTALFFGFKAMVTHTVVQSEKITAAYLQSVATSSIALSANTNAMNELTKSIRDQADADKAHFDANIADHKAIAENMTHVCSALSAFGTNGRAVA